MGVKDYVARGCCYSGISTASVPLLATPPCTADTKGQLLSLNGRSVGVLCRRSRRATRVRLEKALQKLCVP